MGADPAADEGEPASGPGSLRERVTARALAVRDTSLDWVEGRRSSVLVDVPWRAYERDGEIAGSVVGAALAMRLFTFFVPLLLMLVGLAGFVRGRISEQNLTDAGVAGRLAGQVQSALEQPSQTRWLALLTGLVGMASTGRTLSKSMVQASCLAWRIPVHAKASARLFGAVVGMLAGLGLMALLVNVVLDRNGIGIAGISFVGAVAIYLVVWTTVMAQLPRVAPSIGSLLPGAALVAVVLASMQAVSQLYLPSRFERASALYGTIGSAVVVLGWFFIMGRAIILAMELNAVIFERSGTVTEAVFDLPGLRQLARWGWVRRVVGLDDDHDVPDTAPPSG